MACEPFDCEECGQRHERCTGHVDRLPDGTEVPLRPCIKWPRKNTPVCQKHGGNAKQVIAAAERRGVLAEARREFDKLGLELDVEPTEALLREVREAAGNVEFYRYLVQQLPTHPEPSTVVGIDDKGNVIYAHGDPGIYGRTYHLSGVPTGEAKEHVLVKMYNDERNRLVNVAKVAISLGIEERRVRLEENHAIEVFRSITQALTAMGLASRFEEFRGHFADALNANRPVPLGVGARSKG